MLSTSVVVVGGSVVVGGPVLAGDDVRAALGHGEDPAPLSQPLDRVPDGDLGHPVPRHQGLLAGNGTVRPEFATADAPDDVVGDLFVDERPAPSPGTARRADEGALTRHGMGPPGL